MPAITFDEWRTGDAVMIGRAIMDSLAPEEQVARAVVVLDLCRSRCAGIPAVDYVAAIARDAALWRQGHVAFDHVRALTVLEDQSGRTPRACLLFVAEIAAKIVYNASQEPAPFDHDSSWWLANNARYFADAVGDVEFSRAVWTRFAAHARPQSEPANAALHTTPALGRPLRGLPRRPTRQ